jgi:tetratricopeptide (TPR) repeat protein
MRSLLFRSLTAFILPLSFAQIPSAPDPLDALGIRDLSLPADQKQAIRILMLTNRKDDAEKLLVDIIAKTPDVSDARILLARIEYLNKKPGEAAKQFLKADELQHLSARDRLILALAYKANREPQLAIGEFQKLVAKEPDNPEYLYLMGRTQLDTRNPEKAIPVFRKLIAQHPDYMRAYESLGVALEQQSDKNGALAVYKEGVKRDEKLHACPAWLYLNLGALQQESNQWKDAESSLRTAIGCAPLAQAHYRLGLVLQETKRIDEAIEQYRLAIGLQPGYAPPYYVLSRLYTLKGESAKAAQALDAFRHLSAPNGPPPAP